MPPLGVDWVVIMIFMMGGVPTCTYTVVVYNHPELLRCDQLAEPCKHIYGCVYIKLMHLLSA